MKIAFIGGGNMGEAMLSAVLGKDLADAESVTVSDISPIRREYLKQQYGVTVTTDNRQAIAGQDVVVLAVKPQNLVEVMVELKGALGEEQLVLSIIAGARLGTLCQGLEHRYVVRAMPNTPARIGEGMTVWAATPEVTVQQREYTGAVLGAMGREVAVNDDDLIDMATAVSGSGPAYLFFFIEALVDAATGVGRPRKMAYELVLATVLGAGHLLQESDHEPAELRRMVTSPGGTTAAAISRLEEGRFAELLHEAVDAAYRRAKELGPPGI
jgi:pyrroline-5-carboxylate reductase